MKQGASVLILLFRIALFLIIFGIDGFSRLIIFTILSLSFWIEAMKAPHEQVLIAGRMGELGFVSNLLIAIIFTFGVLLYWWIFFH